MLNVFSATAEFKSKARQGDVVVNMFRSGEKILFEAPRFDPDVANLLPVPV